MKIIKVLLCILFLVSFYCCEPLIKVSDLPGDITGVVTDNETSDPIPQAHINLSPVNNSTITGDDGSYLLENIKDGIYDIQASKSGYISTVEDVSVDPANTETVNFSLEGAPEHQFSYNYLDFGIDSTVRRFTLSNIGKGMLVYVLLPSEGWIDIEPSGGQVSTEMDTITVTIDTTGMNGQTQDAFISIIYYVGDDQINEQLGVYVNGVVGPLEEKNYNVVRIGTQIWMAENLNAGDLFGWSLDNLTSDDGHIEKYCYDNAISNCGIYGGMYSWEEAMDYNSEENDPEIMIQGICPDGWHIPDEQEWLILRDYAGGEKFAGGNLKDTGTVENGTGLWLAPNEGATNKYGFKALPGGVVNFNTYDFSHKYEFNGFWYAGGGEYYMTSGSANLDQMVYPEGFPNGVGYVRCIKDP